MRTHTRAAHLAAESAFALETRLADQHAYATLLVALRGFYAPIEDALATVAGWQQLRPSIEIGSRRRAALLDDDLARLGVSAGVGVSASAAGQQPHPPAPGSPAPGSLPLGSLARALGCLYVLEGSALGGRIVARRAHAVLGDQLPTAFFSSADRAELGADWHCLKAALDDFGADRGEAASRDVLTAAGETFAALGDWLERQAPPR